LDSFNPISLRLRENLMMKRCLLLLVLILLFTHTNLAQIRPHHQRPQKVTAAKEQSVVGILYSILPAYRKTPTGFIEGYYLKTPTGVRLFLISMKTEFLGIEKPKARHLGAEWQMIYHDSGSDQADPITDRIRFTGRVEPSITDAQGLVYEYSRPILAGDYQDAYTKLSATAKQEISFATFTGLYKNNMTKQEVWFWATTQICSHTDDKVMLISEQMATVKAYQRLEVVREGGNWRVNKLSTVTQDRSLIECREP
jgi:hypothetical protein